MSSTAASAPSSSSPSTSTFPTDSQPYPPADSSSSPADSPSAPADSSSAPAAGRPVPSADPSPFLESEPGLRRQSPVHRRTKASTWDCSRFPIAGSPTEPPFAPSGALSPGALVLKASHGTPTEPPFAPSGARSPGALVLKALSPLGVLYLAALALAMYAGYCGDEDGRCILSVKDALVGIGGAAGLLSFVDSNTPDEMKGWRARWTQLCWLVSLLDLQTRLGVEMIAMSLALLSLSLRSSHCKHYLLDAVTFSAAMLAFLFVVTVGPVFARYGQKILWASILGPPSVIVVSAAVSIGAEVTEAMHGNDDSCWEDAFYETRPVSWIYICCLALVIDDILWFLAPRMFDCCRRRARVWREHSEPVSQPPLVEVIVVQ